MEMATKVATAIRLTSVLMVWLPVFLGDTAAANTLYLTPFLNDDRASEARQQSRVTNIPWDVTNGRIPESYSGFITTNSEMGDHQFFWYFPAESVPSSSPLFVYLSGRPGSTSMQGELWENGPVAVEVDKSTGQVKVTRRETRWTTHFSMLYIDSPVGVGFSHSDSRLKKRKFNSKLVSNALFHFMEQFYQIYPETRILPLYIGGEAYAANYAINLAQLIDKDNQNKENFDQTHLEGVYLMSPFIDPISQQKVLTKDMSYKGLITKSQAAEYAKALDALKQRMQNSEPGSDISLGMVQATLAPYEEVAENWPYGSFSLENFRTGEGTNFTAIKSAMMKLRDSLHVGSSLDFVSYDKTFGSVHFGSNFFQSSLQELGELLDKQYKVLVLAGSKDGYIDFFGHFTTLDSTQWKHQHEIRQKGEEWMDASGGRLAVVTHVEVLCFVILENAGNQMPHDAPKETMKTIVDFVQNGCLVIE